MDSLQELGSKIALAILTGIIAAITFAVILADLSNPDVGMIESLVNTVAHAVADGIRATFSSKL